MFVGLSLTQPAGISQDVDIVARHIIVSDIQSITLIKHYFLMDRKRVLTYIVWQIYDAAINLLLKFALLSYNICFFFTGTVGDHVVCECAANCRKKRFCIQVQELYCLRLKQLENLA